MSGISICMLGKFDILVDGVSVMPYMGKSSKSVLLLKYLILFQNKTVPISSLIDIFWSDDERSGNPENALKTMISRIRQNLSKADAVFKNCILTESRGYRWNTEIPCKIDIFRFEKLAKRLQTATELNEETQELYNEAISIYRGDLSYSSIEEDWTVGRSLYLHHMYTKLVNSYIDLLKSREDHEMIIHVCRLALDIDAYDERLNLELMKALKHIGQSNAAAVQYKHILNSYRKHLGVDPSEELQAVYNELTSSEADSEIKETQNSLDGSEIATDVFVCNYTLFDDLYQLLKQNSERSTHKLFMAIFSIDSTNSDEELSSGKMENVMKELFEILKTSLRKGDTIARYSPSQYAILLPMMNHEDGKSVINRIKNIFCQKVNDDSITINFQFGSVDEKISEK